MADSNVVTATRSERPVLDELEMQYRHVCETPSDINEHCPTLYLLAAQCLHVTEMGCRRGISTTALLRAQPRTLVCYDLQRLPEFDDVLRITGRTELRYHEANTLEVEIEPTDLLFIDTFHVYEQLRRELELHAGQVRRFIALHDTTTYGEWGEWEGQRGLWPAVVEFLVAHPEWWVAARYQHNHGLTILERRHQPTKRDFRILTARGEIRVSGVIRRSEAIFTPPLAIGVVIGTFAAVPYIHLQLEARRRLYPHVRLLVHDDASPKQDELRRLCDEYGCEFESNNSRRPSHVGDVSCFLGGLVWAQRNHLDILVKLSRRFLPIVDWTPELRDLALTSQYPTYCNVTTSFGFGFRSECVGMAVREWISGRAHEQLAMIAMDSEPPFVEALVHNIAKRLAEFRCERAVRWDEVMGPRPDDRAGYAPWKFMGTDRCERYPQFLWHDSARPNDYHELARQWELPYALGDFVDPNQGSGTTPAQDTTLAPSSGFVFGE
jgi:hypothetical protein